MQGIFDFLLKIFQHYPLIVMYFICILIECWFLVNFKIIKKNYLILLFVLM